MKLNYKNISCSPITSDECIDCVFRDIECEIICEYYNDCSFVKTNGDIFNENIL